MLILASVVVVLIRLLNEDGLLLHGGIELDVAAVVGHPVGHGTGKGIVLPLLVPHLLLIVMLHCLCNRFH